MGRDASSSIQDGCSVLGTAIICHGAICNFLGRELNGMTEYGFIFPHDRHAKSSVNFHLFRFTGVGSISYTLLSRKLILTGSRCRISDQVSFRQGTFHRVLFTRHPSWTICDALASFPSFLISP